MILDNSERIKHIKRLFYMISVLLVASFAALMFMDQVGRALLAAGILVVWFLVFQAIDFQYIYFSTDDDKIILRFYPAVKFGRKEYQTIEFPSNLLHDYTIEKSVFGMVEDLVLLVRTKRGVAEYPSVSMAALSQSDRQKIKRSLQELLHR
ncbi:MAG: hypothetical protein ACOZDD_14275 [Bacteroidota bacterium]